MSTMSFEQVICALQEANPGREIPVDAIRDHLQDGDETDDGSASLEESQLDGLAMYFDLTMPCTVRNPNRRTPDLTTFFTEETIAAVSGALEEIEAVANVEDEKEEPAPEAAGDQEVGEEPDAAGSRYGGLRLLRREDDEVIEDDDLAEDDDTDLLEVVPVGSAVIDPFVDYMIRSKRFARKGRKAVLLPSAPDSPEGIQKLTLAELASSIAARATILVNGEHRIQPKASNLGPVLQSDDFLRVPEVHEEVRYPLFGEDWSDPRPGLSSKLGIYQAIPEIEPLDGFHHLARLLKGFPLEPDDGSLANLLASMLAMSCPLPLGPQPLLNIGASQVGVGKSYLAFALQILFGHRTASGITVESDRNLETKIATAAMNGDRVILFDNVKAKGKFSSQLLEKLVTAPDNDFRVLRTNQRFESRNLGVYVVTANDLEMSRDLVNRSLRVNFREGFDPMAREAGDNVLSYVRRHRVQILGELLGAVMRWRDAGRPDVQVPCRSREWAWPIAGMLEHAGISGFQSNYRGQEGAFNLVHTRLMAIGARHADKRLPAGEWLEVFKSEGVTPEQLGFPEGVRPSTEALQSKLGLLFKDAKDTTEVVGRKTVTLRGEETRHARGKVYRFETQEREGRSTSVHDLVRRSERRTIAEGRPVF